jgi:CO/xanthine dehydrogenase Mo-binding subunit
VGLLAAGANPVSTAIVRLEADGTATLLVSSTEMGQGTRTVLGQLVSQELGLPLERIKVPGADTWMTPYDRSTGASRSTTLAGLAVQRAAGQVRAQLLEVAGSVFQVAPGAVELKDGAAHYAGRRLTHAELIKARFGFAGGELIGHGEVRPSDGQGSYAEGPVFWEVCVGGVQLSVDRETGRIRIEKLVSVADVGQAINPRLIKGQEMGGAMQGLGNAIYEEMVFEEGQLLNGSLLDYHIPTTADMPDQFSSCLVENEDGPGPFGAKGVGEGSLAAVPAAIVNALADLGLQVNELPLTPERVWRAVQASEAQRR